LIWKILSFKKTLDNMIEIIVGTNRRNSTTGLLAQVVKDLYDKLKVESQILDLAKLPIESLSPDAYQDKPHKVLNYTQRILRAEGLVVITPEYNGSMPGALKLFIDLLPFPESFENRPVCYIGLAAGMFGALRPVEHLMQIFGYRNAYNFPQRVFLPHAYKVLNSEKGILDSSLEERLLVQAENFIKFCKNLKPSC